MGCSTFCFFFFFEAISEGFTCGSLGIFNYFWVWQGKAQGKNTNIEKNQKKKKKTSDRKPPFVNHFNSILQEVCIFIVFSLLSNIGWYQKRMFYYASPKRKYLILVIISSRTIHDLKTIQNPKKKKKKGNHYMHWENWLSALEKAGLVWYIVYRILFSLAD